MVKGVVVWVDEDFDFSIEYLELLNFIAEQLAIHDEEENAKHEPKS